MRISFLILMCAAASFAAAPFAADTLQTAKGKITMTFIGHGTLMFNYDGFIVHVDPIGKYAGYDTLPKADLILVTHDHYDHLDADAIAKITTEKTVIIASGKCAEVLKGALILKNGDMKTLKDLSIEVVPAYNIVHKNQDQVPFHSKGEGNGYIMQYADKRIYVAGDTENIPEMKNLTKINVAFLPMNLPYTMTPEMVAEAVKAFRPDIVYPYHYGKTDTAKLLQLLKGEKNIRVRIRNLE